LKEAEYEVAEVAYNQIQIHHRYTVTKEMIAGMFNLLLCITLKQRNLALPLLQCKEKISVVQDPELVDSLLAELNNCPVVGIDTGIKNIMMEI